MAYGNLYDARTNQAMHLDMERSERARALMSKHHQDPLFDTYTPPKFLITILHGVNQVPVSFHMNRQCSSP